MIENLEKETAELFYVSSVTSVTGEKSQTWISQGTFTCAAGNAVGGYVVLSPGGLYPNQRVFITSSDLTFEEGNRILFEDKYWLVVDVGKGRTLYGCGEVLFRRIVCRQVLAV